MSKNLKKTFIYTFNDYILSKRGKGGKMKAKKIAEILVDIGAINWGLAIFGINLVSYLSIGWLITIVYALIGLSGLWLLIDLFKK